MKISDHSKTPTNPFGDQSRLFHFYPSQSHKQVLHRITRGLEGNCGLILLTGEIGIGKTSVCRHLVQTCDDSYIFAESGNPFLKPAEQLYHFCKQFCVDTTGRNSIHDLTEALAHFFVEQAKLNKKTVIIIDESHLLSSEHFALLLVLYNMRYGTIPLVQIILVGQVEIMDKLREPGFEALNQRIGVRCELAPLTAKETVNYIAFKLEQAAFPTLAVFEKQALTRIWHITGGLPRLINHACSHALDKISFTGVESVSEKLIDDVSSDPMYQDLFTIRTKKNTQRYSIAAGLVATIIVGILATTQLTLFSEKPATHAELAGQRINPKLTQSATSKIVPVKTSQQPKAQPSAAPPALSAGSHKLIQDTGKITEKTQPMTAQSVSETSTDNATQKKINAANSAPAMTARAHRETAVPRIVSGRPEILDDGSHPAISALNVSAVAWSEKTKARMAVVNDRIFHEGDQVGALTLETINKNSLVFELDGIRYRKSIL